jgi:hypothetical protein
MINPKTETFTRSFSEYRLKDILETIGNDTPLRLTGVHLSFPVQPDWLAEITTSAQQTLLIATDKLTDNKLLEYCQACFQRKVRVYLLLGKSEESEEAIRLLSGHCLIRTGVKQAGSLLMADNRQGLVLSRSLDGELQTTAVLRLDSTQLTDYYRYFCRLFWNQAKQEYLLPNQHRAVKSSPFGEIAVQNECHDPKLLLKTIQKQWTNSELATLSELRQEKWLGYTLNQFSTTEGQHIINLNNADVASLQTLVKRCTQLACVEQPLSDMVLSTGDEILFLPQSTLPPNTAAWVVKLVEPQIGEVKAFMARLWEDAPLRYQETCLLQEMVHPFRFLDEPKKVYQPQDWLEHRLGDIYLDSMTTFMNPDIDSLTYDSTQFNRERIALEIKFSVTLHPPYLPTDAKLDELHHQWEQAQQKWKRKIDTLRGLLKKVEEQELSFQGKVKSFLQILLTGNIQWKLTQDKQITELAQWSPLYAVERQEKLDAINKMTDNLQRKLGNMQEEQDKAEQHIVWEEKRNDLKKQLGEAQKHRDKCIQDCEQFEVDYKLQEQKKSAELEAQWQVFVSQTISEKTWTKIMKNHSAKPQDWPVQFKNALTEEDSDKHKNLKEQMSALQADKILNLVELKAFFNALNKEEKKEAKRIKEILSIFRASSQTEQEKLDKKLKQAERDATDLQQNIEKNGDRFIYVASNQREDSSLKDVMHHDVAKNKIKKPTTFQVEWPSEELPTASMELYRHKKQRWLCITEKAQFAQGQQDAERLKAILCTKKTTEM